MELGSTELSSLLFHRIAIDMPKAHKIESCYDCVFTWFCPFKRGVILLFEEAFLHPGNTSGKNRKRCFQKSHFQDAALTPK